jgi:hypothetical protein
MSRLLIDAPSMYFWERVRSLHAEVVRERRRQEYERKMQEVVERTLARDNVLHGAAQFDKENY